MILNKEKLNCKDKKEFGEDFSNESIHTELDRIIDIQNMYIGGDLA